MACWRIVSLFETLRPQYIPTQPYVSPFLVAKDVNFREYLRDH